MLSLLSNATVLQVTAATTAQHSNNQMDPWQLVLEASTVVKLVMLLLVLMSLVSWFIVGAKGLQLMRASMASRKFLDIFWDSTGWGHGWNAERLEAAYGRLSSVEASPVARVFRAGYVELARVTGGDGEVPQGRAIQGDSHNIDRALRRAAASEITALESAIPFLATTGSVAPFVGLFGTVWGVMNSFIGIGNLGTASLAVVAPGIAEALIATAIGLAAAIPAVIAYNHFVRRIRVLESEIDAFSSDYLNIVRRHFLNS